MSHTHSYWRTDRPAEGFYTTELAAEPTRPVRTFLPEGYEPRYPYPLLVLFHGRGGNEESVLRLAPKLSRRNFVAISLRGPEPVAAVDGRPAYAWADGADDRVTEYLLRAVEQTRRAYHIHSERVYLVGVHDGAAAAYRAAFALAGRVAGVAALNGAVPRPVGGNPVCRLDQLRQLRVMIGHGVANTAVPYASAVRDRNLFYAAGAEVALHTYPTTNKMHPDMLRDVNRWVMGQVTADCDQLVGGR